MVVMLQHCQVSIACGSCTGCPIPVTALLSHAHWSSTIELEYNRCAGAGAGAQSCCWGGDTWFASSAVIHRGTSQTHAGMYIWSPVRQHTTLQPCRWLGLCNSADWWQACRPPGAAQEWTTVLS